MRELLLASHVTSQHSTWGVCICMNAAQTIVVRLQVVSLMRTVPMLWLKVLLEAERIREVFCLAIGYGHSVKAELSYELQHPK